MRVLIVEDDPALLDAVATLFREESYQVDTADNGPDGLALATQVLYDLLVLDIMLPGIDGLRIIQQLRKQAVTTPILLLTARDSVEDRVRGLDAGADDYLTKPFAMPELSARSRALLRRLGGVTYDGDVTYGRLTLRPRAHDGFVDNLPLKLTVKEFKLLEFLLINREQILTKEQIYDRVWGIDVTAQSSVVDVYVHYLRKKLAALGCDHLIQTIRGVGYMLKENA